MKRATMVYIEIDHIEKIKGFGIDNLSHLVNTLLSKYIAETEITDKPVIIDDWDTNLQQNKAKSDKAYQGWLKGEKEKEDQEKEKDYQKKLVKYRELLDKGMDREQARKEAGIV